MSQHDDSVTLCQMLDHLEEALTYAQRRSRDDLDADRLFFLALLKLVEIVGEGASRVSEITQKASPQIPWRQLIGTRNRLVHGYDAVDKNILWDIVTLDFPPLALRIKELLPKG